MVWAGIDFTNIDDVLPPHVEYTLRMNGNINFLLFIVYSIFFNFHFISIMELHLKGFISVLLIVIFNFLVRQFQKNTLHTGGADPK